MVCGGCVQKLALRLVQNHKIDLIYAMELAHKGMERHEQNQRTRPLETVEHHTDITLSCVGSSGGGLCGTQGCRITAPPYERCAGLGHCSGTCLCPDTPAHAHKTSDDCSCDECCGNYGAGACPDGCSCHCTGHCYYDCDVGYVYNPITGNCEPVAGKQPLGDGIVFTI
jgi:hypothetical protein